jgi:predicted anti-sigma-YlaC factor YlaD
MHRSIRGALIRDGLPEGLSEGLEEAGSAGLHEHLRSCEECSAEITAMQAHSALLRELRTPEEADPPAGFYARVLQRIEERAKESIWAVFVYSPFAKRLTYASFVLAALLGSYVVAQESRDGHLTAPTMVAQGSRYDPPVIGSQAQQRDAVLENFAFERGSIQ